MVVLRGGLGVEKIESWFFGVLEREVHYCHFASSSEFKMKPMLLIVNTLFAHSKDTVDSSFKIRRLL